MSDVDQLARAADAATIAALRRGSYGSQFSTRRSIAAQGPSLSLATNSDRRGRWGRVGESPRPRHGLRAASQPCRAQPLAQPEHGAFIQMRNHDRRRRQWVSDD
jgi:hypothetical protein